MDRVDRLSAEVAYKVASLSPIEAISVLEQFRIDVETQVVEACARTAYDWCRVNGVSPVGVYSEIRRVNMQVA